MECFGIDNSGAQTPILWNLQRHQTWMGARIVREARLISNPRPHVAWVSRITRIQGGGTT
jgi:hypothetical protein